MKSWTIPKEAKSESCVAAAFAIFCEIPLSEFIARLERRGGKFLGTYHLQQCMDVAWDCGFATSIIQLNPLITPIQDVRVANEPILFPETNYVRFMNYLRSNVGVLGGLRDKGSEHPAIGHAVAWDKAFIYDPRGHVYDYHAATSPPHRFFVNNFCMLTKVAQG